MNAFRLLLAGACLALAACASAPANTEKFAAGSTATRTDAPAQDVAPANRKTLSSESWVKNIDRD